MAFIIAAKDDLGSRSGQYITITQNQRQLRMSADFIRENNLESYFYCQISYEDQTHRLRLEFFRKKENGTLYKLCAPPGTTSRTMSFIAIANFFNLKEIHGRYNPIKHGNDHDFVIELTTERINKMKTKQNTKRLSKNHDYITSQDYDQLWDLSMSKSVICFVTCSDTSFDTAATTFKNGEVLVYASGIVYFHANNISSFKKECTAANLEYIFPGNGKWNFEQFSWVLDWAIEDAKIFSKDLVMLYQFAIDKRYKKSVDKVWTMFNKKFL